MCFSQKVFMQVVDYSRLLAYDHWANHECLAAMRSTTAVPTDIVGRIAHILSAQKLWLERIQGQKQTLPVWPNLSIGECQSLAEVMSRAWSAYLAQIQNSPEALTRNVEYRNTQGQAFTSRVEDILTHVLFHSAYHRGQIALQMRASGTTPAYTDFIHAVRQGFVE
jgi:uncharacterized damage-inducible protein DinB